jgi:hypothetical protein
VPNKHGTVWIHTRVQGLTTSTRGFQRADSSIMPAENSAAFVVSCLDHQKVGVSE